MAVIGVRRLYRSLWVFRGFPQTRIDSLATVQRESECLAKSDLCEAIRPCSTFLRFIPDFARPQHRILCGWCAMELPPSK
jgi:hypothetical protein